MGISTLLESVPASLEDGDHSVPVLDDGDDSVPVLDDGDDSVPILEDGDDSVPVPEDGDDSVPIPEDGDDSVLKGGEASQGDAVYAALTLCYKCYVIVGGNTSLA